MADGVGGAGSNPFSAKTDADANYARDTGTQTAGQTAKPLSRGVGISAVRGHTWLRTEASASTKRTELFTNHAYTNLPQAYRDAIAAYLVKHPDCLDDFRAVLEKMGLPKEYKEAIAFYIITHPDHLHNVRATLEKPGTAQEILLKRAWLEQKQSEQLALLFKHNQTEDAAKKYLAHKTYIDKIFQAAGCHKDQFQAQGFKDWLKNERAKDINLSIVYDTYFAKYVDHLELAAKHIDVVVAPRPISERQLVDDWLKKHPLPRPREVVEALTGELDELSEKSQRYFLEQVLSKYTTDAFVNIGSLADLVAQNKKVSESARHLFAKLILDRAIAFVDGPHQNPAQARALALDVLRAMPYDARGLGPMLSGLKPPSNALRFALCIGNQPLPDTYFTKGSDGWRDIHAYLNDPKVLSDARNQVLAALNKVDITDENKKAINAIVFAIRDTTNPVDVRSRTPELVHTLAFALAREQNPNDPALRLKIESLLADEFGVNFLLAGASERKETALIAAAETPAISKELFNNVKNDSLAKHTIAEAMARATVKQEIARAIADREKPIPDPEATIKRLTNIFERTYFGPLVAYNPDIPREQRSAALHIALYNSDITAEKFEALPRFHNDPWYVFAKPLAEIYAAKYPDAPPRVLRGQNTVKFVVGWSMHRKPTIPEGLNITEADLIAALKQLAKGEVPELLTKYDFYPNDETVQNITKNIYSHADLSDNGSPQIGYQYITNVGLDVGGIDHSILFSVRTGTDDKGNPKYAYIDPANKVFADTVAKAPELESYHEYYIDTDTPDVPVSAFQNWLETNHMDGMVAYRDKSGELVAEETPKARDTTGKALDHTAQGFVMLGMIAGYIELDGLPALVAGGLGAVGSLYLAGKEFQEGIWVLDHGGSVTSVEALRHWLNTGTALMGAFAFGSKVGGNLLEGASDFEQLAKGLKWTGEMSSRSALVGSAVASGDNINNFRKNHKSMSRSVQISQALDMLIDALMFTTSAQDIFGAHESTPKIGDAPTLPKAWVAGGDAGNPATPKAGAPAAPKAAHPPEMGAHFAPIGPEGHGGPPPHAGQPKTPPVTGHEENAIASQHKYEQQQQEAELQHLQATGTGGDHKGTHSDNHAIGALAMQAAGPGGGGGKAGGPPKGGGGGKGVSGPNKPGGDHPSGSSGGSAGQPPGGTSPPSETPTPWMTEGERPSDSTTPSNPTSGSNRPTSGFGSQPHLDALDAYLDAATEKWRVENLITAALERGASREIMGELYMRLDKAKAAFKAAGQPYEKIIGGQDDVFGNSWD